MGPPGRYTQRLANDGVCRHGEARVQFNDMGV